jgi:hypothetical protein
MARTIPGSGAGIAIGRKGSKSARNRIKLKEAVDSPAAWFLSFANDSRSPGCELRNDPGAMSEARRLARILKARSRRSRMQMAQQAFEKTRLSTEHGTDPSLGSIALVNRGRAGAGYPEKRSIANR